MFETVARRVLRAVFGGGSDINSATQVLAPQVGTDYSVGVGTPFLVQHPTGGVTYFLFTGWATVGGTNREIFIGEIDENLNVRNVRKLLAVGSPIADLDSHGSISVVYDATNDNWLLFTGSHSVSTGNNYICFLRYNNDFTTLISYEAPAQLSGADWVATDGGAGAIRVRGLPHLWIAYTTPAPAPGIPRMAHTIDPTLNIPTFTSIAQPIYPNLPNANYRLYIGTLQLIHGYDWLTLLAESFVDNMMRIYPIFLPGPVFGYTGAIGGRPSEDLIIPFGSYLDLNMGHPHLTWLPNNRNLNLFFCIFKAWPPSNRHEIYATVLPPDSLNPKNYRDITFIPWYEETILAAAVSYPFWGYGKKTIWFETDTNGNLTIEADFVGTGSWKEVHVEVVVGGTPVIFSVDYHARFMRLTFSAGATVTSFVTEELR